MGLFSFLGEKKPERTPFPSYRASQHDAPSSEILAKQFQDKSQGIGTGFSPEGMSKLEGQAIDDSAMAQREYQRMFGQQTSRGTGAVTSGSAQRLQERALNTGFTLRSQAMRDIGIRNEVLKRQDQQFGLSGLQGFLNSERNQANYIYGTQDLGQYDADVKINEAIRSWKESQRKGWINVGETAARSALMAF